MRDAFDLLVPTALVLVTATLAVGLYALSAAATSGAPIPTS